VLEGTLNPEGVQLLVLTDHKELMSISAAGKRRWLKIFADEVVRFGTHWHQLDRVFDLYASLLLFSFAFSTISSTSCHCNFLLVRFPLSRTWDSNFLFSSLNNQQ
jgi:hypothetical protein